MKIQKNAVVSLRLEIVDEQGSRLGEQQLVYLHGGHGNLFPKVEAALAGREPGERVSVRLAPADGFGERDPALVRVEPRSRLPRDVALGTQFDGEADEGDGHRPVYRVAALSDTEATLDANHPLAGRTVELRCSVVDVRPATQDEIAHGHVHGPGAHHEH